VAGHHLILGEATDYLTGEILADTHDERYRQKVARLLVEDKGYARKEIHPRWPLRVAAGEKGAVLTVDFKIVLSGKDAMVIRYGPGSLVTRRRSVLAVSRLLSPYPIPIAVITNGEDAEVLSGREGKLLGQGLASIPRREALLEIIARHLFDPLPPLRIEMEQRILYAYEVDGACPCDDTICRL